MGVVGSIVEMPDHCWPLLRDSFVPVDFIRLGDSLRRPDLAEIRPDGSVRVWQPPETRETVIPVRHGFDELVTVQFAYRGVALSPSGDYYALLQLTDHYELVRFNLDAMPFEDFPPAANTPPQLIAPEAPQQAKVGVPMSFIVTAVDPEELQVTIKITGVPPGAVAGRYGNMTAIFKWTPTAANVGTHTVTFETRDQLCGKARLDVTLTVVP